MPANRVVSERQLEMLVEHLEVHRALALGRLNGPLARQSMHRQWEELALTLNSVGVGASKTGAKWRDYWNEKKYQTRRKAADLRVHASGTGGGPAKKGALSPLELRLLAILGKVAVEGNESVRIPFNLKLQRELGVKVPSTLPLPPPLLPVPHASHSSTQETSAAVPTLTYAPAVLPIAWTPPASSGSTFRPRLLMPTGAEEIAPAPPLSPSPAQQSDSTANDNDATEPAVLSSAGRRRNSNNPNIPQWAVEIEARRVAAAERQASALEQQAQTMAQQTLLLQQMAESMVASRQSLANIEQMMFSILTGTPVTVADS